MPADLELSLLPSVLPAEMELSFLYRLFFVFLIKLQISHFQEPQNLAFSLDILAKLVHRDSVQPSCQAPAVVSDGDWGIPR